MLPKPLCDCITQSHRPQLTPRFGRERSNPQFSSQPPLPKRDRPSTATLGPSDRPPTWLPDRAKSNRVICAGDCARHRGQRLSEHCPLAPCTRCDHFEEALFRINLRLRELFLTIPIKQLNLAVIRNRIAAQGSSARLERDLKDQDEQIHDLIQLAEDWLNLAEFITENQPRYQSLSKPLKAMLRQLGVDFERPASVTDPNY